MAIHRELRRFLITGSINTAASWLLYLALCHGLTWLHPGPLASGNLLFSADKLAYTAAYAFGIVFTYYLNTRWVFHVAMSWRAFLRFPLIYVVQYSLGIVLMHVLVDRIAFPVDFAPLAVIAMTMPVSFLLSRLLLKRQAS